MAVLGEPQDSVQADQIRLAGRRSTIASVGMQVHTLTLADGSSIRQFVSPQGRVFAVAWNSHGKPRLDQLLGTHFGAYADAGRRSLQQRPGVRHHLVVQEGELVVESTAHLDAYVGRAWLRSLLPAGLSPDALR